MTRRIFKLFSAGVVAVGLSAAAASAASLRVNVDGSVWDVSTASGTFETLSGTLSSQEWWGSSAKADAFADAVFAAIATTGQTNFPEYAFAYRTSGSQPPFADWVIPCSTLIICDETGPVDGIQRSWAVGSKVSAVPLPASVSLLLLGLAGFAGLGRRKKRAAQV